MAIIFKHDEIKRGDQAVSVCASHDINLIILQSAIEQAQIHYARGFSEFETVFCGQPFVAIGPLNEFITNAKTQLPRDGSGIGKRFQAQAACIGAAHHHGKSVIEAERGQYFQSKSAARIRSFTLLNTARDQKPASLSGWRPAPFPCIPRTCRCVRRAAPDGRYTFRPDRSAGR